MSFAPAWRLAYSPALDGLRALAVLLVVLRHTWESRFPGAGVGVDVFFVLSGFLITSLLLGEIEESGDVSILRFYARRALRLAPALLLFMATVLLFVLVVPQYRHDTVAATPYVLFYVGNWARAGGDQLGLFSHTWSLGVEEQFYVLWPVALILGYRRWKLRGVLAAALAGGTLSLIAREVLWRSEAPAARISNGFDTKVFLLLAGCAAATALFVGWRPPSRALPWVAGAGFALIALAACSPAARQQADRFLLLVLGVVAVVLSLVLLPDSLPSRALSIAPWVYIGRISYGIYLWHYPVSYVARVNHAPGLQSFLLVCAVSLLLAAVSFRFVEKPLIGMRARLRHQPTTDEHLSADPLVAVAGAPR